MSVWAKNQAYHCSMKFFLLYETSVDICRLSWTKKPWRYKSPKPLFPASSGWQKMFISQCSQCSQCSSHKPLFLASSGWHGTESTNTNTNTNTQIHKPLFLACSDWHGTESTALVPALPRSFPSELQEPEQFPGKDKTDPPVSEKQMTWETTVKIT